MCPWSKRADELEFRSQFLIMHGIQGEEPGCRQDSAGRALCNLMHRFGKELCGSKFPSSDAHFLLDQRLLSFILTQKSVIDE